MVLADWRIWSRVQCMNISRDTKKGQMPPGVQDKRVAIDMLIVKEALARCGAPLRWSPASCQLADVLTKDAAEPADKIPKLISCF